MKLPWEMFFLKSIQAIICWTCQSELPISAQLACEPSLAFSLAQMMLEAGIVRLEPPSSSNCLGPAVPSGWGLRWTRCEQSPKELGGAPTCVNDPVR